MGSFAVQLAKAFGAQVTGVCSTRRVDLVGSIGADQVIDSTQGDCTRTRRRWDLLLELAGNRSLAALRRALSPNGDAGAGGRVGWSVVAGDRSHPQRGPGCRRLWASGCGRCCPSRGERTWWCCRSSSKPGR